MSRKKEQRIKRLQRHLTWPAVFSFVVSAVIIVAIGFFCWFVIAGLLHAMILDNTRDCRRIVQAVNQGWNQDDTLYLSDRLDALIEESEYVNELAILDADYKPFETLDKTTRSPDVYLKNKEKALLDKEGFVYFSYEDLVYLVSHEQVLSEPLRVVQGLALKEFINTKSLMEWADKKIISYDLSALYSTDFPDVYVFFKTSFLVNNACLAGLVGTVIFFGLALIYCICWQVSRLIKAVSEKHRINRILLTDSVTGGNNKDFFLQKASKAIRRYPKKYAVVQLRLEKYRKFCTAYGIQQGEKLLEDINALMQQAIGKKELVAHIEKSDFALLLSYYDKKSFEGRLRLIMDSIRERHSGRHLSFSAGVCPCESKYDDMLELLNCAGIAIPKEASSQDETAWFNDAMKEALVWERRIEDDMEKGLTEHEFQVYLQPKFSTGKEELSAAEALVRWTHPQLGFISPGKFIPLFERNGFIIQLDDYMLTEVARLQAGWAAEGKSLVPISVNVSRAHFAKENLAEHICSLVDRFKVPHEYIELELTESAFFDDKAVLINTVRTLQQAGFKVSMDDFGAGYSSLNSLKELPLDIIKLDAEFFRNSDDMERSKLIVEQTISLAKRLGMEIVAEGIETRDQVDFLAKLDCDLIQGFYFSKPLPVKEFEDRAYRSNYETKNL